MADLVPAVDRALRILRLYRNGEAEYGVSELSRVLGLNKSTVHDIVQTLYQHQILDRNESTRKYVLGSALVQLGDLARKRRDIRSVARPHLPQLMESIGATVFLGVFENDGITIVDKAELPEELSITASIGQRIPFCAGSFGRAFLAHMTPAEVDRLLAEKGLRQFTATSITAPSAYRQRLEQVRQQGYAVDDAAEYLEGVWAVSAPIRDFAGVVAALTAVGFSGRLTPAQKSAAIQATAQLAGQLSERMGAQPAVET